MSDPRPRFLDTGPPVEIIDGPAWLLEALASSGHVADDLSGLWNLTAAAPRRVAGPSLQELDDAADEMAAVVATQLGRVAGFAARNLGGVTVAASGLWNFQTGAGPGTPRQAAVSADDLGVIRDRWTVVTDDVLGPKIAADYLAGAQGQHGRLAAALPAGARGRAGVNTQQAALLYAAQIANRWKDVGDELWAAARTALLEGMARGESVAKLARRIRDATGVSMGRAMTIARTESMAARSAGSYEEMLASGVVVSKTWQATGDLRTRPTHVVADGQTVPMTAKFTVGGWPADRPHDSLLPPEESVNCRCVGPDIAVSGVLSAAMRRPFHGYLWQLVTANGHQLTATADHPVMTRSGWQPLGALRPGDDVLCCRQRENALGTGGGPYPADSQTRAEEVWRTLAFMAALGKRTVGSAHNLDGDIGLYENIDVAVAKHNFTFGPDAQSLQHLSELGVAVTHGDVSPSRGPTALDWVAHAQIGGFGSGARYQPQVIETEHDVLSCRPDATGDALHGLALVPGSGDDCMVLIGAGGPILSPADIAGSTYLDASSDRLMYSAQASVDDGGDFLKTVASLIEADPVIRNSRVAFCGHVYDFSSPLGVFTADGIIVHNCTLTYGVDTAGQE